MSFMVNQMITRHQWLAGLAFTLMLGACGGEAPGVATNTGARDMVQPSGPQPAGRTVTGAASKGPIRNAGVSFFELDGFGFPLPTPIASTTTDAAGNFSVTLPPDVGTVLVETSGGVFTDESDQQTDLASKRQIALGPDQHFLSVLPTGATSVAITPYTHALVEQARADAVLGGFQAAFTAANAKLSAETGFDMVTTIPADPIAPGSGASQDAVQYAMLLGAVASVANSAAIQLGLASPNYDIIIAVIKDLADGRLDGNHFNDPVTVTVNNQIRTLPNNIDFDAQLNRFRNNNFVSYANTPVPVINTATLVNAKPVANAGADQVVMAATAVTLDASQSTDANGSIASFAWTQQAGPAVTLTGANTASPTLTAPASMLTQQVLVFNVAVVDNDGRPATDMVQITVTPLLPAVSFVSDILAVPFSQGNRVDGGSRITFNQDGTGLLVDDVGPFTFAWTEVAGVVSLDFTANPEGGATSVRTEFNEIELTVTEVVQRVEISNPTVVSPQRIDLNIRVIGIDRTFNVNAEIQEPDLPFDETDSGSMFNVAAALPFADPPGTVMLPTNVRTAITTLPDFNPLFPDELVFNADGTGNAEQKDVAFTWTRNADKSLSVTFADGESAIYRRLEVLAGEGDVAAVEYTFSDGKQIAAAELSFARSDDAWVAANLAGSYSTVNAFELNDGNETTQTVTYRYYPDGTGQLEFESIDPATGAKTLTSSSYGICWRVDGDGDLESNRVILHPTQDFSPERIPTPAHCAAHTAEADVFFRRVHLLFDFEGNNVKELTEYHQNNGEGSPFPGGSLVHQGLNASVYQRVLFNGMPPAPRFDFVSTQSAADPLTINVLANDVAGSSAIDPATVTILGPPQHGTATVNATTGELTFTPSGPFLEDRIQYRVSDVNGNASIFADVNISLEPLANAGIDQQAGPLDTVILDATASVAASGNATYAWSQQSGPEVSIINGNTATATFTPLPKLTEPDSYSFRVDVSDATGRTTSDFVNVIVRSGFQPLSYFARLLDVPFQFGNDVGTAGKILIDNNGTGTYTDRSNATDFTWTESAGTLILDFANAGGHQTNQFTHFPDFDNDGLQEQVTTTSVTDLIEVTLLTETPNVDTAAVRILSTTTNVIDFDPGTPVDPNVTPLVTTDDRTLPGYKFFTTGARIPFVINPGEKRTLPVELLSVIPTLDDTAGLYPDELTFNSATTGAAALKGDSFLWALDADGNVDVTFSPSGDTVKYMRFENRPGGEVVIADMLLAGSTARTTATLSFLDDPAAVWNSATVPGIYISRGSATLSDGTVVPDTIDYRLHPGGVGVLELPNTVVNPATGARGSTRSSNAICWEIDINGDLVFSRISVSQQELTANLPTPGYCSTHLVESDISFRRVNKLYRREGNVLKTWVINDQNNGTDFPFPGGTLERNSIFPRIFEFTAFAGDQQPPVLTNSFSSVSGGVGASGVVLSSGDLQINQLNSSDLLDPTSVEILNVANGTAVANATTGEITFTASVASGTGTVNYVVKDTDGNLSTFGTVSVSILP